MIEKLKVKIVQHVNICMSSLLSVPVYNFLVHISDSLKRMNDL